MLYYELYFHSIVHLLCSLINTRDVFEEMACQLLITVSSDSGSLQFFSDNI